MHFLVPAAAYLTGLPAILWATLHPYLLTARAFEPAQVPGLLSGMGVVNTVSVFAYSTALSRVAGLKHRRNAVVAFVFAWVAVLLVVVGYVLNSYLDWPTGAMVDAGLVVWILSFASALYFIYLGAKDVVGRGRRSHERFAAFAEHPPASRFGVPFIDRVIALSARARGHVNYPFLLIHDIDSPGLSIAAAFVRRAITYRNFVMPGLDPGIHAVPCRRPLDFAHIIAVPRFRLRPEEPRGCPRIKSGEGQARP